MMSEEDSENYKLSPLISQGLSERLLETYNLIELRYLDIEKYLRQHDDLIFLNDNYRSIIFNTATYLLYAAKTFFDEAAHCFNYRKIGKDKFLYLSIIYNKLQTIERILWKYEISLRERNLKENAAKYIIKALIACDAYANECIQSTQKNYQFKPIVISYTVTEDPPKLELGFIPPLTKHMQKFKRLIPVWIPYFLYVPKHHYFHTRLMPYIAHEIGHLFMSVNPYDENFFSKLKWFYQLEGFVKSKVDLSYVKQIIEKYIGNEVKSIWDHFKKIYLNIFNDIPLNLVDFIHILEEIYCDVYATLIAGPSYPLTLISAYPVPTVEYNEVSIQRFLRLYACTKVCEEMNYKGLDNESIATYFKEYIEKTFHEKIASIIKNNKKINDYSEVIDSIIGQVKKYVILSTFEESDWSLCLKDAKKVIGGHKDLMDLKGKSPLYIMNVIWAIRLKDGSKYRLTYETPRHSFHVIELFTDR